MGTCFVTVIRGDLIVGADEEVLALNRQRDPAEGPADAFHVNLGDVDHLIRHGSSSKRYER